ncbi:MAG: SUMF1/EgtB/PvdO family nonheme iron enzyme [Anaerolineae bacterium]|nr:SUMF1/EgtB/PvdO family nonheme iron enzyme [Anaerolineae bacterium]
MTDKLSPTEYNFIDPEQAQLPLELKKIETTHERRRDIGDGLGIIGDTRPGVGPKDGLPDIRWLPIEVAPHPVTIKTKDNEIGPITILPFFMAQYQITYAQFDTFLRAEDGFKEDRWWFGVPEQYQKQAMRSPRTKIANAPRDSISWYQCVAFARWLSHRLNGWEQPHFNGQLLRVGDNAEVRLPTEWEWQWAAQGGMEARQYPWGKWQDGSANTSEAGLSRTTAVGMYPQGSTAIGLMDMAGNLFEWCQNDYKDFLIVDGYDNKQHKVLRGGSFDANRHRATCAARYDHPVNNRHFRHGLRVVVGPPLRP